MIYISYILFVEDKIYEYTYHDIYIYIYIIFNTSYSRYIIFQTGLVVFLRPRGAGRAGRGSPTPGGAAALPALGLSGDGALVQGGCLGTENPLI